MHQMILSEDIFDKLCDLVCMSEEERKGIMEMTVSCNAGCPVTVKITKEATYKDKE